MDTLKVCHLGLVACVYESFKSSLHKLGYAAAKNCLLTKEVGFSFLSEGGFKDTCSACTDTASVCESVVLSLTGVVLVYSDERRNALALLVLCSNGVTGALGSYHDNIDVLLGLNEAVVDIEAVSEHKNVAVLHVRSNLSVVNVSCKLIGNEHHNDVCSLCCILNLHNLEVGVLLSESCCLLPVAATLTKTYYNVASALCEVHRVSMSLATESDNCYGFVLYKGKITIGVIILVNHFFVLLWSMLKFLFFD